MPADKRSHAKPPTTIYRFSGKAPERVLRLLEDRRIKEQEFAQADVIAVWQKAVGSARDAALDGLSVDSAIRLAYDAGHCGALALLALHGLKTSSGQGHHEIAFHAAAALGGNSLDDLVADSEEIRGLRKGSTYDPTIAGEDERERALAWIANTLPLMRAAMVKTDPTLETRLVTIS